MIEILLQLKEENPKSGFTYNIKNRHHVKFGFVVAYKETQNSHTKEELEKAIAHAKRHGNIIGGWFDRDTGKYYFDSSRIFKDLNEAYRFALENEQVAIYDLTRFIEIRINKGG